ncbi:hypothetical protein N7478_007772 [Penicillium angulare]|uniref:uncharacterized protein n=1 Tax=Penicillium angulare TaxID=116970 RepID=UPI002541A443|nr:uncharacterized protein N7478_007772 [Penicillium angulare]KAJ5272647.1 hypothetical protein N7478_007772 [Penicillium angulare]
MHGKEAVLSFDLEENDFLYRVRRDSRIVHVSVLHGDIILPRERTESSLILSHLRGVPKWYENWTTLTVRKGLDGVIQSAVDEFPPHPLNTKLLDSQTPNYFNILILERLHRISDRVSLREVTTYASLVSRGFCFAPRVLGYVYEEQKDPTIAFLMEYIVGTTPRAKEDFGACEKTI